MHLCTAKCTLQCALLHSVQCSALYDIPVHLSKGELLIVIDQTGCMMNCGVYVWTMHNALCPLNDLHCTVYIVLRTMYSLHCVLQFTLHEEPFILLCSVHGINHQVMGLFTHWHHVTWHCKCGIIYIYSSGLTCKHLSICYKSLLNHTDSKWKWLILCHWVRH